MNNTAHAVLVTFLCAFSRLDLDAMLRCFAADATAFLPAEHQPTRLAGADAIGSALAGVIASVRATGAIGMPLDAEDVVVQEWGDTAIATFHLRKMHLSRRTIILRRQAAQWRIIHLHASNAPLDE
jgi:ketosteroid isomerase-like protein